MKKRCLPLLLVLVLPACRPAELNAPKEVFFPEELAIFATAIPLEMSFSALPRQGFIAAERAWPAFYWPSFRGGTLHRFFGEAKSPLEKFEQAFGVSLLELNPGTYAPGDLAALELERTKDITATWAGICDGSSLASLYFDEPKQSKIVNGVVFYPFEIKALMSYFSALSHGQDYLFAGHRFRYDDPVVDDDGRGFDWRLRDLNPGMFHILLGNLVGLRQHGIIADIAVDKVVLNFPIKGYRVLSAEVVTDEREQLVLGQFDMDAASLVKVKMQITFGESHRVIEPLDFEPNVTITYDYVLALDLAGKITGGEWLGVSRTRHPDFLWMTKNDDLNWREFSTDRLSRSIRVGHALASLLEAQDYSEGFIDLDRFSSSDDNLSGYRLFEGSSEVPAPQRY